eukprot:COSAG01_NODE_67227_length_267_cov_1.845238_1_plen_68_part_10
MTIEHIVLLFRFGVNSLQSKVPYWIERAKVHLDRGRKAQLQTVKEAKLEEAMHREQTRRSVVSAEYLA